VQPARNLTPPEPFVKRANPVIGPILAMIDCHAHAFPTLADSLARLSPRAGEVAQDLSAALKRLVPAAIREPVAEAIRHPIVDVEDAAAMRKKEVGRTLEPAIAVGLMPQVLATSSVADLIASMERHGIEKTVLIAGEPVSTNEWILAQARAHEGKLVPVVNVPRLTASAGETEWGDGFEALAKAGARGFKIHLNADGLGHDHVAYRVAFEVAAAHDLFVIVHTGCFHADGYYKNLDPAEPALFAPLFERFPTVRVCLAHMNRDDPERAWEVQRRFQQVWSDTSWQPRENVRRAVREVGAGRLLLGSDWPLLHGELQGDVAAILRESANADDVDRIGDANARAFLGE
jgi:predicted TIM-barrel fold metal-dependent hydrolase